MLKQENMGFEIIEDHTLHTRYLNRDSLVLDLGANFGKFSKAMIARFGCRCVAVEPSPEIFQQIEPHELLQKYNLAIAPVNGPVEFNISENPLSSSLVYESECPSKTITVSGKRLDELVAELGWNRIDVLKMDIEGVEIDVFRSCSDSFLKSIGQISVEFHDLMGIVSKSEVKQIISRLESLGFVFVSRSLRCYYDTLFINRAIYPISMTEYLWNRHVIRNWQIVERRFQKWQRNLAS